MEQVELVIKIPKEYYDLLMSGRFYLCGARGNGKTVTSEVMKSICTGTPLPKGHGRLIDADAIPYKKIMLDYDDGEFYYGVTQPYIDRMPTIIEADKEYDVKAITRGNCIICGKELTEGIFFCKECEEKGRK